MLQFKMIKIRHRHGTNKNLCQGFFTSDNPYIFDRKLRQVGCQLVIDNCFQNFAD